MSNDVLAFAGAEGYGAHTVGGRGGQVVTVTNLNDSGQGSLRWALEDVSGPRTVVFAVNGAITLKSQILIENPNVTIAGQTALGEGITIEGSRIRVKADDVVIRGLKFRPGDGAVGENPGDRDGLMIGTTDFQVNNVIVDHNSFTWGVDENIGINGSIKDVTISNNIIAEGLSNSIHPKGEHSKGLLVSNWDSLDGAYDSNISIVKNLFASNSQRNPEVRAGQNIEIVNNYMYDYGLSHMVIAIGGASNGVLKTSVAVVGNYIEPGPSSQNYKMPIALSKMGAGSEVFVSDNLWTKIATDALGNQDQSKLSWNNGGLSYLSASDAALSDQVKILDSQQVRAYVLANVGASPGGWDSVDQRIIDYVTDHTGKIVDSVAQAGGRAANIAVRPAADSDKDGMSNWFEDLFGLNSQVKDNNGDTDRDGYTNLEEYINGLISGFDTPLAAGVKTVSATAGKTDIFALGNPAAPVSIKGFNGAEGDRLDIIALLKDVPTGANLADYVEVVEAGNSTYVSIDADGLGTQSVMRLVARLDGTTDLRSTDIIPTAAVAAPAPTPAPANPADTAGQVADPIVETFNKVTGKAVADSIKGGAGRDHLIGAGGADTLAGNAGNDWLQGDEGNDKLDGGIGADLMEGGAGDDTYAVDDAGDVVVEAAGAGADSVNASVTFALGEHLENLTLTGAGNIDGAGNALANKITGNTGANVLAGGDGDDSLAGREGNDRLFGGAGADKIDGGTGADLMAGGAGADTYMVDNAADSILEYADEGVDSVSSTVSLTLSANIENLTLAGTAAIDGAGNDLGNKIVGNAAANCLSGGAGDDNLTGGAGNDRLLGGTGMDKLDGGLGADYMAGGEGDDLYLVDDAGDQIAEEIGGGVDTVNAAASFTLAGEIENLSLTGAAAINGSGNGLANKITGNVGNNILSGAAGADTLSGGDGADWLYGGMDNDRLDGGLGADRLDGGQGVDTLTGGAGADAFIFRKGDSGLTALTIDTISDFRFGEDRIGLEGLGGLSRAAFSSETIASNSYDVALAKAQSIMGGGQKDAVFVAGQTSSWLFWDTGGDAKADQAVLLKGLGSANIGLQVDYFDMLAPLI